MNDQPVPSNEDRSKWRYEQGGAPFDAAVTFVHLLKDPDIASRLDEVTALVTATSWPTWRAAVEKGIDHVLLVELTGFSMTVRYPANGMAYVFCPITHPDQDEAMVMEGRQVMYLHVVTLVEDAGEWRVHQVGSMVPPQDLGLTAYSW